MACATGTAEEKTECFFEEVGKITNKDCEQCVLAFAAYYLEDGGIPTDATTAITAITSFCIDGDGPPVREVARKLVPSNVCSDTDTDLETVSLTILGIFNGTFPTEAIVPAYTPVTTVTTGTTTTGTTTTGTTTGTSTTTTGTTSTTGTSSAVHLRSISSLFLLVVASAGIWA